MAAAYGIPPSAVSLAALWQRDPSFRYPGAPDLSNIGPSFAQGVKIGDYFRQRGIEDATGAAIQGAMGADGQIDEGVLLSKLGQVNPTEALALNKEIEARDIQRQGAAMQLATLQNNIEHQRAQLGQGQARIDADKGKFEWEKTQANSEPPKTREVKVGSDIVTEEWDRANQMWKQVGKAPVKNTGMALRVNEDGSLELVSGDAQLPQGGLPYGKPTQNKIEAAIVDNAARTDRLNRIWETYNPKFLEYETKAKDWGNRQLDKLGLAGPEQQAAIANMARFKTTAMNDLTQLLKEMSGAAVTPQEAERQLKVIADAENDSPAQFLAKMKETMRTHAASQARLIKMRVLGMQPTFDKDGKVTSFGGMQLQGAPVPVKDDADAIAKKLPPGTLVEYPDGGFGVTTP